jgi:meiosis-specific serine/threonine-protein kinase MEK1
MPADCWSTGVILFIMLSGGHPFDFGPSADTSDVWISHVSEARSVQCSQQPSRVYLQSELKLKSRIVKGELDLDRFPFHELPKGLCLIQSSPHSLVQPIMTTARNLVASLLTHDPQLRATAQDAMQSLWISTEAKQLEAAYDRRVLGIAE